MLIKDLENYQLENNQYPGQYVINQYVGPVSYTQLDVYKRQECAG